MQVLGVQWSILTAHANAQQMSIVSGTHQLSCKNCKLDMPAVAQQQVAYLTCKPFLPTHSCRMQAAHYPC